VVVPVSLSFVRAPAHPGYPELKGCKNGCSLEALMASNNRVVLCVLMV